MISICFSPRIADLTHMNMQYNKYLAMIEEKVKSIISEILDIEENNLSKDTDLIKEIGAESIDLLEIAISLEKGFGIKVDENRLFLKSFRYYLDEVKNKKVDEINYLNEIYPFLDKKRIKELIEESKNSIIPSIRIKDIVSYVQWTIGKDNKKKKEH